MPKLYKFHPLNEKKQEYLTLSMGLFDWFKRKTEKSQINERRFWDNLPEAYKEFLEENSEGIEYSFNEYKEEDPDFDGRYWNMLGKSELFDSWEMNGVGTARNFECLKLYIQLQREYTESEFTTSNVGNVSLERVESGFVIGDENGDYLYLDVSDNYSVWIYHHDGGDVLKVADSFEKFIMS